MKTKAFIFSVLLISLTLFVNAQKDNISAEETTRYINQKLKGEYILKESKGQLEVEVYKNNKLNRVDKVALQDLNPDNVYYAADEKAVIMRCIGGKCVSRKIFEPATKGDYPRINIVGDFDVKTQNGLVKALEHLIRMYHDNKYKNNTPFEE